MYQKHNIHNIPTRKSYQRRRRGYQYLFSLWALILIHWSSAVWAAPDPTAVTTLAGSSSGYADGTGTAAQFNAPRGVALDTAGNLYVADTDNHCIRKIVLATGAVSTLAGSTQGYADATGTAAQFEGPRSVVVDTAGNLYVADTDNNRIRKIVIATGMVTTLAGNGTAGYLDATGTAAQFNHPRGVAIDTAGNLYVADSSNDRIRKIVLATGVVTTLAGDTEGYADDTGTAAKFNFPYGVAVDKTGNLYVADSSNHRIRKIVLATGVVTTLAGSTKGYLDATGTAAQFNYPYGIVVDTAGNLYVADTDNNRIRKMSPPPPADFSSTPAPASTINVGTATVSSSVSTTLSISETGTAQLDVTSLALSGTDAAEFSVSPSTAFSIADGGAQTVTLTCTPTIAGSKTATLTVTHNGTGTVSSPVTYTLNCTGTASLTYTVTPPLPEQLSLFLQVDGTGHGKVTTDTGLSCQSSDCQVDIKSGDLKCNPQNCTQLEKTTSYVTLTPQADADSVFSSWGGNEDCIDGQVFMNGSKLCIAYFHRIYSLTLSLQGVGQVQGLGWDQQPMGIDCGTQCEASYSSGTTVYLQATPATGLNFLGWGGQCEGMRNPLAVTVNQEMKCEARFGTLELPPVVVTPEPVVPPTVVTPAVVPVTPAEASTPVDSTPVVPSIPAEASTPVASTPVVPSIPAEASTPVASTPVASTPVASTPVVVTPVVTPVPVTVTPIQLPSLVSTACATTGNIGEVCNYGGREVTNLNVQGSGIVSNGLLNTTVINTGWVSNFHITATGKLSGGVVTGYIKNEGVMLDFDFKGMSIIGGTLGGVITNTSRVGGFFQDVTLLPNTKITGGILSGIIKGDKDKPALLENVRVKGRSKLSGVKLGKNVKLEKGVVVKDK